jgi:hypothetical protein
MGVRVIDENVSNTAEQLFFRLCKAMAETWQKDHISYADFHELNKLFCEYLLHPDSNKDARFNSFSQIELIREKCRKQNES